MSKYFTKPLLISIITFTAVFKSAFALDNELPIWPSKAPGSESLDLIDSIVNRNLSGSCTIDRAISNIDTPTITPFIPENPNGTSVIICPGGAYIRIVYDVEGTNIAEMFNEIGITAFVLKYRLPCGDHTNSKYVTLQDAQRAIRYVKKNAATWQLDTSKVGIMGCSAGGHAAASLATDFDKKVYTAIDSADSISAHPGFSIFLYPVISMDSAITHAGTRTALLRTSTPSDSDVNEFSTEKHVTTNTPPAFIAVADDDGSVDPENSERYSDSLTSKGVKNSLYIYSDGEHGKGICKADGYDFANWVSDCKLWLDSMNLTTASTALKKAVTSRNSITKLTCNYNHNSLNIKSSDGTVLEKITISSSSGKILFSKYINKTAISINTASYAKGIYFIKQYCNKTVSPVTVFIQ